MSKPLKPHEVEYGIPNCVIDAVNDLITDNFRGLDSEFEITQAELIERIHHYDSTMTRERIIEKKYLDFEEMYEKHGWKITYKIADYTENFPAYFVFKAIK